MLYGLAHNQGQGRTGMHFEVTRAIAAKPQTVWSILTDKGKLLSGDFGILKFEGDIAPGQSIKLWSEVSPNRAFPLKVSQYDAPRHMVWEGGMPFGLFKGVRQFKLTQKGSGTEFSMREDYTGLLKGLIGKSIPNLTPSFEKFATALQRAAEGA
jgi:hypothetical protein